MIGTLLNFATILIGGLVGLLAGNKIPDRLRNTLISGLGLFTLGYGVKVFSETQNILIPLGSLIVGTLIGEALKIEESLDGLGLKLSERFTRSSAADSESSQRFITGFVSTSLLFCIGPMAILGSIQDGLTGNFEMLAIKALLDGLAAVAFASTLGVGVLFSAAMVLIYQGAITLLAKLAGSGMSEALITEMTAVGGLILMGIGLSNLLEIKKIRTGSFLPALLVVVILVLVLQTFGIAF